MKRFLLLFSFLFLFIFLWVWPTHSGGNVQSPSHRLWLGLKMFPTIVGGNTHLEDKQNKDGTLVLLVVYHNSEKTAHKIASRLRNRTKTVHEYPFRLVITNDLSFHTWKTTPVAGVFLAEPLPAAGLQRVIQYGIKHKVITFSSFPNDVGRGILAGLHISSRILPAFNARTIRLSEIEFPAFFKKIAYYHE